MTGLLIDTRDVDFAALGSPLSMGLEDLVNYLEGRGLPFESLRARAGSWLPLTARLRVVSGLFDPLIVRLLLGGRDLYGGCGSPQSSAPHLLELFP